MANLLNTLLRRGKSDEVSRYDLSWYLNQLNNPFAVMGSGLGWGATTRDGRPVENIENNFPGYVNAAYKSNGVIFAIVLARLLLFSEARFALRDQHSSGPGSLYRTDALNLLEHPWPNGTTGELLSRMEQDVSLAGNAYIVNEGDRLRRLRPDWVSIVLSEPPEQAVTSDVIGYMYTPGGLNSGSTPEFYLPEDIAHWSPIPDPVAQYRGMSWLSPVVQEIRADDAATKHKDAFYSNGAAPGIIVAFKETVTEEQFTAFQTAFNEAHQGPVNAYKPMFLGGGADVTVAANHLGQLNFKETQGAGETRLCAAGGVPPVIVGLSEGLQAATYSNYSSARRKFGDGWARPQWRSACAALAVLVDVPAGAELWYRDTEIAFLREDQADAANIQSTKASTIAALITAGFTPESAVASVDADDRSLLVHTGLVSVQLQPPGAGVPTDPGQPTGETDPDNDGDNDTSATGDADNDAGAARSRWTPFDLLRGWSADLHPRGPGGRFVKLGGGHLSAAGGKVEVRDLSSTKLYALFSDLVEEDPPNERALRAVNAELEHREDTARRKLLARKNPLPATFKNTSDDRLMELWSAHAADPDAVKRITTEIAARRRAAERADQTPLLDWQHHGEDTLAQRRIDKSIAAGADPVEAYANAYAIDASDLVHEQRLTLVDLERRAGESRRDAVRRAYAEHVALAYTGAEQSVRGHLLTDEAKRSGIDPMSLFSGPSARARKWASEDLKRYWAQHPRTTYTEFAAQVLTGDKHAAKKIRLQGNGRDFGV